ncbi:MAG: hypothetical protein P4L99_15745 [Chthoniobacter sp.]|nr:hypothetical protein [Chthoniobacter sp.]
MGLYLPVASAGDFSTYHIGNSLTGDLLSKFPKIAAPYENAQGNTYKWGAHFRPATSISYMYANPNGPRSQSAKGTNTDYIWLNVDAVGFVPWSTALPGNHWDVVTLQPWQDDTKATLKGDTEAVNAIIAVTQARADNASTRFFIYAPWTAVKYEDLESYRTAFLTSTSNRPEQLGTASRDYFRHVTDRVRQTNPNVAMIPAGEVLLALDDAMRAGKFAHFTSVRQLHRDEIHLNSVGQNVAAWTAYATIFKKSPIGLPNDILTSLPCVPPFENVTDISPADLKLMQETVWTVVNSSELRDYTKVQ